MADPDEKIQFKVHLGTWTNWSRGPILGATLTLEPRYGLLLLSFTATFVGFVASRLWRIISLILHRIYSTPEPRDALHHQRQAVLRNSMSPISTIWTTLQLAWCWRTIADGILSRTLPIIIFATLGVFALTIAGGFTSSISTGIGNEVLIDGSRCGFVYADSVTDDSLSVIYPWSAQSKKDAANYAQQCYSLNTTGTLECKTFVKSRLQFTSILNASCPFSDSICRSNDSNLLLDTGLISSDDVGLNLPINQRMFYRHVLHCAPLRTIGFTKNVSTEQTDYTRYYYGSAITITPEPDMDWTYQAETIDKKLARMYYNQRLGGNNGFDLLPTSARMVNGTVHLGTSQFMPIPQLIVSDADLDVISLSQEQMHYLNQTNDPWYRGIIPQPNVIGSRRSGGRRTAFVSDEASSPMGCVTRIQYCNSNKKCGSLASFADAAYSAAPLFHYPRERIYSSGNSSEELDATASRFEMFEASLISSSSLKDLLIGLGPSSLLSLEHLFQGLMGPLPDNQWQLEAIHWFEMLLASIQASYVNTARGPTNDALMPYTARPGSEYHWQLCRNQKIRSTDYTALSLFGLYFTYITGLIVILASYIAEPLLALCYSRSKYKEYKYLEWAANSTLQLQRLAYQGLGSEKWTNYTDDIPKTRPGYFLADLTRAYPDEDDGDETQEVKPTVNAASATSPSVSDVSTNQCISEQPHGGPRPAPPTPRSQAPEPLRQTVPHIWEAVPPHPQPVSTSSPAMTPSPQATTPGLQAVLPNARAVSPVSQTVSPISHSDAV